MNRNEHVSTFDKRLIAVSGLTRFQIKELYRNLFNKVKSDITNKYRNLIRDKDFDFEKFSPKIAKEIEIFAFDEHPYYLQLFRYIEKIFLHEISANSSVYTLHKQPYTKESITTITNPSHQYQYNSPSSLFVGKVTLRSLINNDISGTITNVDKYKKHTAPSRQVTKTEKMHQYNTSLST